MSTAPDEPKSFDLPDGRRVLLRVFGDEFASRLETLDGYAAIYDPALADFVYASLKSGSYVSTGVPVGQPAPEGLHKHLLEAPAVRDQRRENRLQKKRPLATSGLETFGPNAGLLRGRRRSSGTVRGLTIIVEFQDFRAKASVADVAAMMNDEGYSRHGHVGSVRDYFLKMSSSKLDFTNHVVGPVRLSQNRSYYDDVLLVDEALDLAIDQFGLNLEDFATQLPNERHKVVDALSFLYAGESVMDPKTEGNLWPHNSELTIKYGNVRTHFYMLTGLGESPAGLRIGTICHELGHMLLRLADLYDTDYSSEGAGVYCLMGAGNWLGDEAIPAPLCGYQRKLVQWIDHEVVLEPGRSYDIRHGTYDTLHRHKTSVDGEYFIVENRGRLGYDRYLPSNGLAVMHCDIMGNNDYEEGTPDRHYQCALLQADGRKHLETNKNRGDATDLYLERHGEFLSGSTTPHSRTWDGADSGLILRNCSGAGEVMTVHVGPPPAAEGAFAEDFPSAEIPDAKAEGIRCRLTLPPGTPAKQIEVAITITHTWREDVEIQLIAPDGRIIMLREQQGGSTDDIREVFRSDSHAALATFTGESGEGTWTLWVRDLAARDVGLLRKWSIRCE